MMKVLESERIILRPWQLSDIEDLFEYAQSPLVGPSAGWKPHKDINESKEIIKMFMDSGDVYAIELKAENKIIGGIGLHNRKPDLALVDLNQREIGYVLNPKYWGQGYVPESVDRLIKYSFEELELDLLWCAHHSDNLKSKRVIEKSSFEYHFTKEEILERLDNKEVTTLYYKISNQRYFAK